MNFDEAVTELHKLFDQLKPGESFETLFLGGHIKEMKDHPGKSGWVLTLAGKMPEVMDQMLHNVAAHIWQRMTIHGKYVHIDRLCTLYMEVNRAEDARLAEMGATLELTEQMIEDLQQLPGVTVIRLGEGDTVEQMHNVLEDMLGEKSTKH